MIDFLAFCSKDFECVTMIDFSSTRARGLSVVSSAMIRILQLGPDVSNGSLAAKKYDVKSPARPMISLRPRVLPVQNRRAAVA
jgi:hypothetical protein